MTQRRTRTPQLHPAAEPTPALPPPPPPTHHHRARADHMGKRPQPENTPSKYTTLAAATIDYSDLVEENKRCGLLARGAGDKLRRLLLEHIALRGTVVPADAENDASAAGDSSEQETAPTGGASAATTTSATDSSTSDDSDDELATAAATAAAEPARTALGATSGNGTKKKKTTRTQKPKKAPNWAMHHDCRLAHCLKERRGEAQQIFGKRTRLQQDGMRSSLELWEAILEFFMDQDEEAGFFLHAGMDDDGEDITSPGRGTRIDITSIDPNHSSIFARQWTAKQLKEKWRELRAIMTPYMAKHNASGQNAPVGGDPDDDSDEENEAASITNFLPHPEGDWSPRGTMPKAPFGSKGSDRPRGEILYKEKMIKYVHTLYKGDSDLLSYACRAISFGDAREGGTSDTEDGGGFDDGWEDSGTRSGRRGKRARKAGAPLTAAPAGVTDAGLKAAFTVLAPNTAAAAAEAAAAQMAVVFPQYSAAPHGTPLRLCLARTLQALCPQVVLPELMGTSPPPPPPPQPPPQPHPLDQGQGQAGDGAAVSAA
eukprot:COSAG01_NODE_2341_length_7870_cov_22.046712_8_plen_543_part_00